MGEKFNIELIVREYRQLILFLIASFFYPVGVSYHLVFTITVMYKENRLPIEKSFLLFSLTFGLVILIF